MTTKNDPNTLKSLGLSAGQLDTYFRRLNLAHMRRIYKEVAGRAEKESWSYRDFLALLLAEEVARRKQTRLQRCTRSAHFPFLKTIDEFDFTLQSTLRQSLISSYLGPDFVTEGRSLILHGKTGRGKTHLAVAIGYRAIQNGFETLFTTAAELIEDLSNASKRGHLQESLAAYTHPHVLVIDEVGYLTYGPDAANVLFHVVNDRHLRKRPMVFTTNKPLNEWGKVLHDEDMAAAILDRVLERGRFIHLDGPSGRTRHLNLEQTLLATTERLRISGISGSEFPEPTLLAACPPLARRDRGSRLPSVPLSTWHKTGTRISYCRLLPPRISTTPCATERSGGSVWESNPPSDPRRAGSPALKAGRVTGPLAPPRQPLYREQGEVGAGPRGADRAAQEKRTRRRDRAAPARPGRFLPYDRPRDRRRAWHHSPGRAAGEPNSLQFCSLQCIIVQGDHMRRVTVRKHRLSLRVTIRIERDGKSFHAWTPALSGLHVDGPTKKEALEAARQAVQAYLNSLVRHGEPLPIGFDQAMRSKTTRSSASDSHNITLQWPSLRTSGIN